MKNLNFPLQIICLSLIGTYSLYANAFEVTCDSPDNPACRHTTPVGPAYNSSKQKNSQAKKPQTTHQVIIASPQSGSGYISKPSGEGKYSVQNAQERPSFTEPPRQASPLPELPYETPQNTPQYGTPEYTQFDDPPQTTGACHPEAYAVHIYHFRYDEALPSDLVWSGYGKKDDPKYKIHKSAKASLTQMVNDAKKSGANLKPSSIFRSVARQRQIIASKRNNQKLEHMYAVSSPAGYSEHHTGLAVDFNSISSAFDNSREYNWLVKNASKYGWEQTFTEDYSSWSGVAEESWHWRYVGKQGEFDHIFHKSRMRDCY